MTRAELLEQHQILLQCEEGLRNVKTALNTPMALLTEQTDLPDIAKIAFHADALFLVTRNALKELRLDLKLRIQLMGPDPVEEFHAAPAEEVDEHARHLGAG